MEAVYENISDRVTLEICQLYYELGYNVVWNDGKDMTLEEKEPIADQSK